MSALCYSVSSVVSFGTFLNSAERVSFFHVCFNVIEFMLIIRPVEIQLACNYVINVSQWLDINK